MKNKSPVAKIFSAICIVLAVFYYLHIEYHELHHLYGHITAKSFDENENIDIFMFNDDSGKNDNTLFVIDENTRISTREGYSIDDFLTGKPGLNEVIVSYYPYTKLKMEDGTKTYRAESISVQNYILYDAYTLENGTVLDCIKTSLNDVYTLKDGTVILSYSTVALSEQFVAAYITQISGLNRTAQEKITDFFDNLPLKYTLEEQLEKAYAEYLASDKFQENMVSTNITSSMYNGNIISFTVSSHLPLGGQYRTSTDECYIFDINTGSQISNYDIFSVPVDIAIDKMFEMNNMTDLQLAAKMKKALKPEYIQLSGSGVQIFFPDGVLDSHPTVFIVSNNFSNETMKEILHPWALPEEYR